MNSNNQLIKSVCQGVFLRNLCVEEHLLEILFSKHLYSFKMRIKFDRMCLVYKYCFLFYVHISKKVE